MSSPDITSEMAYFLQDNLVEFLKGATDSELNEFVETLLPHISPVGVNRIYPVVSDPFPARTKVGYEFQSTARDSMPPTMEELADDDDDPILNYGGTNGD
jgi:hypothetical protein